MTDGSATASAATTAVVAGAMTAVMLAQQDEEDNKRRRLSVAGRDQILLETTKNINTVGKEIAELHINWYYSPVEKKIYREIYLGERIFSICGWMIGIAIVLLLLHGLAYIIVNGGLVYHHSYYPMDFETAVISSAIIGILCGIWFTRYDEEKNYIKFFDTRGKTRIQIQVYDSSGYRNVDEIELVEIMEIVQGRHHVPAV